MNEMVKGLTGAPIGAAALAKDAHAVEARIVAVLSDMVQDWGVEADEITGATRLVADLEFVSVDIIHLIVAIEEDFKRPKMGFQELLMKDGRYVDEITVRQLADFVSSKLQGESR